LNRPSRTRTVGAYCHTPLLDGGGTHSFASGFHQIIPHVLSLPQADTSANVIDISRVHVQVTGPGCFLAAGIKKEIDESLYAAATAKNLAIGRFYC